MKKHSMFLVVILCMLVFGSCTSKSTTYTVEQHGVTYEVDTINHLIFDGTHTYQYTFEGNSSTYKVKIIYPDGSTYWWQQQDYSGYGGGSNTYDETKYVPGDRLRDVLFVKAPRESGKGNYLFALLLLLFGSINIASPDTIWYLEYGWRFKKAEPSDTALIWNRVFGVFMVIFAIVLLFV